jgi:DNA repair protein RadC
MTGPKGTPLSEKDGIPYGRIYALLKAWREPTPRVAVPSEHAPSAAEAAAPRWDSAPLVQMFKRLGTVPARYRPRQGALRVLLAATEMARENEATPEEVYADLTALCEAEEDEAVCGAHPRCGECPIREHCAHARRNPSLKELPESERPRERLLAGGERVMSDSELLAILLGGGSRDENALALAQRLLVRFGNLRRVAAAGIGELAALKGVGKAKIARLRAAFAIGRRLSAEPIAAGAAIKSSSQVFRHYRERFKDAKKEVFVCLLLDTKHKIIHEEEVSVGLLNESLVHPREVFNPAIRESAAAVIFVHNHPSGDPKPSRQDEQLTRRLHEAGKVTGIRVLDHVIIGRDGYHSFAENGQLDREATKKKARGH